MNKGLMLALLALVPLGGCAVGYPLMMWQRQVEHYIDHEGYGNPVAVRNLDPNSFAKQFSVIGKETGGLGPKRTDAQAMIIGHRKIGDLYWLIFLVGIVEYQGGMVDVTFDRPKLLDIRAAALADHHGEHLWVVSQPDPQQLAIYTQPQHTAWQASHPTRTAQAAPYPKFPMATDRYRVESAASTVTIHEDHCGARWQIDLQVTNGNASSRSNDSGWFK